MANTQFATRDRADRTFGNREFPTDEVHKELSMEKARAGETSGHVRIVLIVSSLLAVICLGAVVIGFAGGT